MGEEESGDGERVEAAEVRERERERS